MDPRLRGFTEPVNLGFDAARCDWRTCLVFLLEALTVLLTRAVSLIHAVVLVIVLPPLLLLVLVVVVSCRVAAFDVRLSSQSGSYVTQCRGRHSLGGRGGLRLRMLGVIVAFHSVSCAGEDVRRVQRSESLGPRLRSPALSALSFRFLSGQGQTRLAEVASVLPLRKFADRRVSKSRGAAACEVF